MKYTLFLIVATIVSTAWCQQFDKHVKTDKGFVEGRRYRTLWNNLPYTSFLGIPYAKSPVGELRFKDPVEPEPWEGTLNAIEELSPCAQYMLSFPIGKEDCLYLNVYTPALTIYNRTELKPVMVWIHGSGFQGSAQKVFAYSPVHLIEQDVVVVTFSYRVDALGFLALGIPQATGNQGLKDQNMVLRWVQKNIAGFGGDPKQVTIFGQGFGASSVGYHLISPLSEGLFHRAILQSGSPLNPWAYQTPNQAVDSAMELGSRMGVSASTKEELLGALMNANIFDIIRASNSMNNVLAPISMPFVPTIETYASNNIFLNECPISKLQGGAFKRMPIMMGFTHNEALLFTELMDQTREIMYNHIHRSTNEGLGLFSGLFAKVLNDITEGTTSRLSKLASVYFFSGPMDIMQRYLAAHDVDNPVYYYLLHFDDEYNFHKIFDPNINGTAHADDVNLLFHTTLNSPVDTTKPFNVFRNKFVTMWTNFAKCGNPTPTKSDIGLCWKNSGTEGLQLNIGENEYKMTPRAVSVVDELIERMYNMRLPSSSSCNEVLWSTPSIF